MGKNYLKTDQCIEYEKLYVRDLVKGFFLGKKMINIGV